MGSVEALPLRGGVPGRVEQQDVVCGCEVQPNPSGLQRQEQDLRRAGSLLLEQGDHVRPVHVGHRAVQADELEAVLSQEGLEHGQEARELRNDNYLVVRVCLTNTKHFLYCRVDLTAAIVELDTVQLLQNLIFLRLREHRIIVTIILYHNISH